MSAVVKLDLELGVTHEVVAGGGSQNHLEVQGNGQVAETHTESDSEETRFLEPLCPVHTLILELDPRQLHRFCGSQSNQVGDQGVCRCGCVCLHRWLQQNSAG
ncbi:uncharacterized protein LOC116365068 [Oncorhynchus kisutch]|uniref:uncharacterized protein LOC116365068 n=1 Tax=Oncorhynchus kisutch TaxID=8019 RepID=UPI0012DCF2EF|nr:uncharacterized protein LOC116365068 [Oncorhynchus kisutch]